MGGEQEAAEQVPVEDDAQFGEGFNEAAGVEPSPAEKPAKETPPEPKRDQKPVEKPEAQADPGKPPEEKPPDPPPVDWEKRFKDTQGGFTRLSQENASLKKRLEELEKAKQEPPKDDLTDEEKALLADIPELDSISNKRARAIVEERIKDYDEKRSTEFTALRNELSHIMFETSLIGGVRTDDGKWVTGHADARQVLASQEFTDWLGAKAKADPSLLEVNDPVRAIQIISDFKEHAAASSARSHDESVRERKRKVVDASESTLSDTARKDDRAPAAPVTQDAEFSTGFKEATQGP